MENIAVPVFGFIQNMNPLEISLVVFVILLLFGAKRLPELGRGIGQFTREFKKSTREVEESIRASLEEEPAAPVRKSVPPPEPVAKAETRAVESEA